MIRSAISVVAAVGLSACAASQDQPVQRSAPMGDRVIEYLGTEALLMGPDLVSIRAELRGDEVRAAVSRYVDCAVARYAVQNGYGFARHIRTNIAKEGGVWRADAVYSITSALPRGPHTIDAEVVAQDCAAEEIPMV
ncbi:hypothetical protein ACP2AV_09300 [Aliiroseovarius sp. PTFE2010]|uniref:hypothetical protein n=1 Tax=Aliiroseovarius sp. PTFE2010 TaxID=3417190 RepID=UPI003CEFA60E